MRGKGHDPERAAASYLGGRLSKRKRSRFEEHILECEDCWGEVQAGREGRSVAESGRELAPQRMRELVRSSVAAVEPPGYRWRWLFPSIALLLIAALSVVLVTADGQPREIDLALADFKGEDSLGPEVTSRLPAKVGELELVGARAGSAGDLDVTAHTYEDPSGHVLVVYLSDDTWPIAGGAEHAADADTWTADIEGAILYCADSPRPSLVVGEERSDVLSLAEALGLR